MTEKTIKYVPMPCANCNKVTKIPEYAIFCKDCTYGGEDYVPRVTQPSTHKESCSRCGRPYADPTVQVCACHPMFNPDSWGGEQPIEFKTPEDAQRCMKWIDQITFSAVNAEKERLIQRLEQEKRVVTDEEHDAEMKKPCNHTCHNQQIEELVQIIREETL